jgi:ubiquinone/menaquinone biosynthesis C-methylase UbiE
MEREGKLVGAKSERVEYWVDRYERQGERTVGHCALDANGFAEKSIQASNILKEFIEQNRITGGTVLDFGCGVGRMSSVLSWFFDEVRGVDIVPWAVNRAWERCPEGFFVAYDGKVLPFPDKSHNAVLSWTVLQHVPPEEIEGICAEIDRVLKPGGKLILYENTSCWLGNKEHIWFRMAADYGHLFPGYGVLTCQEVENADGTTEIHSLMLLVKR